MKKYMFAIAAIGLLAVSCKSKKDNGSAIAKQPVVVEDVPTEKTEVDNKVKNQYDSLVALVKADSIAAAAASVPDKPQPKTPNDSIRLNVSFYSPGSGINYTAAKKLDGFITKYEADNKGAITVYKTAWGREGEVDYCFKFNNPKDKRADAFVQTVKDLLTGQDRINYKENTTCRKPKM